MKHLKDKIEKELHSLDEKMEKAEEMDFFTLEMANILAKTYNHLCQMEKHKKEHENKEVNDLKIF